MKEYPASTIVLIAYVCASSQLFGQADHNPAAKATPEVARKGYIGLTAGPAVPTKTMSLLGIGPSYNTGFQMNLLQGGYLFTRSLGLTGSVCLSAHAIPDDVVVMVYGSLMIGPMISIPAKKFNVDFRPQIGYSLCAPAAGFLIFGSDVSFGMGVTLRYHPVDNLSILLGVDYFSTSPEFNIDGEVHEQVISTINPGAGIAFRLR